VTSLIRLRGQRAGLLARSRQACATPDRPVGAPKYPTVLSVSVAHATLSVFIDAGRKSADEVLAKIRFESVFSGQ
jgi:hypothetical protein